MNRKRHLMSVLLAFVLLTPATAETIAVSVRQRAEQEAAPLLADFVEQGAMEYLFSEGHIVFDLVVDPDDEVYNFRAIDDALLGGARFVVVIDVSFQGDTAREFAPEHVIVRVLDADAEEQLLEEWLLASDLERGGELDAQTIADRLGALAARRALDAIGGGDSAW